MNKSSIRKRILVLRKRNTSKNLSISPIKILKFLKKKKLKSKIIGAYYPFNYELNILNILKILEKKNYILSLPKVAQNNKMDFFQWSLKEPLKINKYGIPEPESKEIVYPDILLIPLVAFDKNLNRLGYGGGYYDRLIDKLSKKKKIIKIGLALSIQKIDKVPIDVYDQKLDYIVTDRYIIK